MRPAQSVVRVAPGGPRRWRRPPPPCGRGAPRTRGGPSRPGPWRRRTPHQGPDRAGGGVVAQRPDQAVPDVRADAVAQAGHLGVRGEHGGGARRGQLGLVGHEQRDVGQGGADPAGGGASAVHRRFGQGPQASPEDLGDQVVLGREVGVGGGRGHAGPAGHVAHGEAVVAVLAQLLHRGVGQAVHRLGLAVAQQASRCRCAGRARHRPPPLLPRPRRRPPCWTCVQTVVCRARDASPTAGAPTKEGHDQRADHR